MKTITDNSRYGDLQSALLDHIVRYLHSEIESTGLSTDKSLALLESLAFGVSSIVDGVMLIEHGEESITPHLTFVVGDDESEELLDSDEGAGMHLYASGAVQEFVEGLKD